MSPEIPRTPLVGIVMGSKSDWETMRHAADILTELGVPVRGEGRLGASDARAALPVRPRGRRTRAGDDHRRSGGAAHLPGMLAAISILAGPGRSGREQDAEGGGFAAVDRPDAPGRAGGDAGHRCIGSGQRGAAGRGHPGPQVSGNPRRSARRSARLRPTPWENRRNEASPLRRARKTEPNDFTTMSARRVLHPPASLGVIGSGQLGRMFVQAAQRMGYTAGVLGTTADTPAAQVAHWTVIGPPDHLPVPARDGGTGRGDHGGVRERLGSRPALAGAPADRPAGLANGLDQPEPAPREDLSRPLRHSPRSLAAGS